MKLRIKNIGRFYEQAEIQLDGITVLAGLNGLGKSTISKVLYCTFGTFYRFDQQIYEERKRAVTQALIPERLNGQLYRNGWLDRCAEKVIDIASELPDDEGLLEILYENGYPSDEIKDDELSSIRNRLSVIFAVPDDEIKNRVLANRFIAEFGGQIQHVNHKDDEFVIDLEIRNTSIRIIGLRSMRVAKELSLEKEVVYIDDMSSIENFRELLYKNRYSHEVDLSRKIQKSSQKDGSIIDDIIKSDKYRAIIDKLDEMNIGSLVKKGGRDYEYMADGLQETIKLENISAGTKSLLVFKQLMENGYLEENGMLILDEPEVHIHPEWQYLLAEFIVLIKKELGINVLISSHSADFIQFIEYFSKKHNSEKGCNYYIVEEGNESGSSVIRNVNDDRSVIYSVLGNRFIRVTEEMDDLEEVD